MKLMKAAILNKYIYIIYKLVFDVDVRSILHVTQSFTYTV